MKSVHFGNEALQQADMTLKAPSLTLAVGARDMNRLKGILRISQKSHKSRDSFKSGFDAEFKCSF